MAFQADKGIAYCGLVCALCDEGECIGCRKDGCPGKDRCTIRKCCAEKGIDGCFECPEFPCGEKMFKDVRIRAFCRCAKEEGVGRLLEYLKANDEKGIVYHNPGSLKGDYDRFETEEDILSFLRNGRARPQRQA